MVSRFMRPGERIHVLEFFQRLVQIAPDYVRGRDGFSLSSSEEETSLAVANKLFEHLSGGLEMEKNTEQNNQNEEATFSDREVLLTIRYLDPDITPEASNVVVFIIFLAPLSMICAVCILLYLHGL
jgi:hypothetical protein